VAVAGFGVLLTSDLPDEVRRVIGGSGIVGSGLSVAASCVLQIRRTDGRRRRAWMLIASACSVAAIGNAMLTVVDDTPGPGIGSALIDVSLLVALLLSVAGVVTFPSTRRRGTDLTRMVFDGIVIGGSILFMASVTVFPTILDINENVGSRALSLVLPVIDVVVATLAALLFLRGSGTDRPSLALASAGFALYAVSDFSSAAMRARVDFSFGSIVDLGWIAGYLLITIGIVKSAGPATARKEAPAETSPVLGTLVMFALFVTAVLLSLFKVRDEGLSTASAVLWLIVLLAVAGRQILLILDNETLRRGLEQRVIERTSALAKLTQQSDSMVNSVGDGIYGVDHEGIITFVNPAAARALGFGPEQLIGREAHSMFHAVQPNGQPYPQEECYITEAIRNFVVTNAEDDMYVRADGLMVPVEVTATPLSGEEDVRGAVVVFRDVTQRREVDRLKSEFVAMVSHELRTPLTSIRGSLGLLAGGALGALAPPATRMLNIALDSSDRLARLINEILDIERVESGTMSMNVADHAAADLVHAAVQQVQVLAVEAGVSVTVTNVDGGVVADADRVIQTLINLLGNAIKFSPSRTAVEVSTAPRGAFVTFRITDHGRGIPENKLDRIFARFEQVDSSDAREKGGTGLGLAISRSIVERLGGRIWAENNPGGGATFQFTLPQTVERREPHSDDEPTAPLQRAVEVRDVTPADAR
jgi:PAS domain S-box-containing protein